MPATVRSVEQVLLIMEELTRTNRGLISQILDLHKISVQAKVKAGAIGPVDQRS